MLHTHPNEKLTVLLPEDCVALVKELVIRLNGQILDEDEELIIVPPAPSHEWPGKMCKGLRCRSNLSEEELAEALGVPVNHIIEYENHTRPIPVEKATELANILGASQEDFLIGPEEDSRES